MGYVFTKEHRESLRQAALKRKHSEETKNNIAVALIGRRAKRSTRVLMKEREAEKRLSYKTLMQHLELKHPDTQRSLYKDWYLWKTCPVCERKLPMKKTIAVPMVSLEDETKMLDKAVDEEMSLGLRERSGAK